MYPYLVISCLIRLPYRAAYATRICKGGSVTASGLVPGPLDGAVPAWIVFSGHPLI